MHLSKLEQLQESIYALPKDEMMEMLTILAIANIPESLHYDPPITEDQFAAITSFFRAMTKGWEKGGEWHFPGPDASDAQLIKYFAFTADYEQSLSEHEAEKYGDDQP